MLLEELISEKKEKRKKKPPIFVETDETEPFPNDTISGLEKGIGKAAKDLEKNWKSSIELVDFVFSDLKVPKPGAFLTKRWQQYLLLLKLAVDKLASSRGFKADWRSV